ncbi:heterokaryon incompatibility protein-domain-containing protein [Dactylonectria macrodidyma]|uniref:Heterokaryon incompatibility protein-domain-containing protein n=1 Tax=Dactylonectria macrodidyma TaxID=307937 RepID=A0A9P9FTW7_9HYPO|nr:heterokaryon incompatibility protein-domain-containing protein [Dactylonectria macrodidyma]
MPTNYLIEPTLQYFDLIQCPPSPEPLRLGDTAFRYRGLDPRGTEIRLLRILPPKSMQIECALFHVLLDELPPYVAISYTWGDPDDTRSLALEGHDFPVTVNLWQALSRLRSDDSEVIVWVDAICINQMDPNERNHQVQIMTRIYASASSVAIWLGLDYDNSHLAIDLILELTKACQHDIEECKTIILSSHWRFHFEALADLFSRDYWDRLWIVQEVCNSQRADVYCGPSKLSLHEFTLASRILQHHEDHLGTVFSLLDLTKKRKGVADILCHHGPATFVAGHENLGLDLWHALSLTCWHKCQDPRDKIYGILGLLKPEERSRIPVNYSFSKRKVYAIAVKLILETYKSLDIICRNTFSCCRSSEAAQDLPTWLPDFSAPFSAPDISNWGRFDASRGMPAAASIYSAQRKLKVLAIPIDKIDQCSASVQPLAPLHAILTTFLYWRSEVILLFGFSELQHQLFCKFFRIDPTIVPSNVTAEEWMKEVYSTVNYLQKLWLLGVEVDERIRALAPGHAEAGQSTSDNRVLKVLQKVIPGQRFCITEGLRYAIVSGNARPGDEIYVPFGCLMPILLRRVGVEHKFIGEVYMEYYMHGLAIQELEQRKRSFETVILV